MRQEGSQVSPSQEVVVDANVAIKWAIPKVMHEKAKALLDRWLEHETVIWAPASFIVELDSALRKKVSVRKEITLEASRQAWRDIQEIEINYLSLASLRSKAWELSIELDRTNVYDAVYLAAAEQQNCDFWTADERLYNSIKNRFSFVKWLENFNP